MARAAATSDVLRARTDALLNGGLVALGTAAILDNIFPHWLLGLHRAAPGGWATPLEVALFTLGLAMTAVGIARERRARAAQSEAATARVAAEPRADDGVRVG